MNNKGSATLEIIIMVAVFTIVYVVGVINVTYALETDYEETSYLTIIDLIEDQATLYGETKEGLFNEEDTVIIYLKDLVAEGYYVANKDGNVVNPSDEEDILNDLKIKITKVGDKVEAEVITL